MIASGGSKPARSLWVPPYQQGSPASYRFCEGNSGPEVQAVQICRACVCTSVHGARAVSVFCLTMTVGSLGLARSLNRA